MAKKKKITKESVYEEIRKADIKGKKLSAKSKVPFLEQLEEEGEIKKIDSKYYVTEIIPTPEEIYEKVRRAKHDGAPLVPLEVHVAQHLISDRKVKKVGEREIKKIDSKYYATEIIPTPEEIYEKVRRAKHDGASLVPLEVHVAQHLISDRKVKKVGKKYYLERFRPLIQKEVIESLLSEGFLKRVGKKYVIMLEPGKEPSPKPAPSPKVPSFFEFVETLQSIYLRKARGYRQGISILPLIEALTLEMDISRNLAEKWILELPRIFIGVVDLRPSPDIPGLNLEDGSEVSRIYLERGIVGL